MTKVLKYMGKFKELTEKISEDDVDVLVFCRDQGGIDEGHCINSYRGGLEFALRVITRILNEENKNE